MKKLAAGAMIALVGCGQPRETRKMTSEERARLVDVMDIGDRSVETVNQLARSLDQPLFNAEGETVDAETYIATLDAQRGQLREMYENDRIFVFASDADNLPDIGDAEAAAYYKAADARGPAYVALNEGYLELWNIGTLMHEIAHLTYDAPYSVDRNGDGHNDELNAVYGKSALEIAEVTWEVKDSPNVNTLLHAPVDDIIYITKFSATSMSEFVFSIVESGEMTTEEALVYYDGRVPDTVDKWITAELDGYIIPNNEEAYDFLGWDRDEMAESMRLSTLHEYVLGVYSAKRTELMERLREFDEAGAEAKRERHRETRPGKKL